MAKLTIFRFRGHISREERFRQLFVEIYPRLLRYAIQLMSDREEAKDIVGEVMEEAWKCFDRLEAETQNAYFYTATRNTCLNRLKHLRVEQQHLDTLREVTRMGETDLSASCRTVGNKSGYGEETYFESFTDFT